MFHIQVYTTGNDKLEVNVLRLKTDLPVADNIKNGVTAEFLSEEVGAYTICVEFNGILMDGTPSLGKPSMLLEHS